MRVPHGGRGQPPWGMHAEDYARRIGVDLETLAAETTGYAGADLANLINEGALLAARGFEPVGYAALDAR